MHYTYRNNRGKAIACRGYFAFCAVKRWGNSCIGSRTNYSHVVLRVGGAFGGETEYAGVAG